MFIGSKPVVVIYFTLAVVTNNTDDLTSVAQNILDYVSLLKSFFLIFSCSLAL